QHSGYSLLSERLVGSKEVTLSELVDKLGSSDWVAAGMQYLERSSGLCPFCQENTPATLASDLSALFDASYTSQVNSLNDFVSAFRQWQEATESLSGDYDEDSKSYLNSES